MEARARADAKATSSTDFGGKIAPENKVSTQSTGVDQEEVNNCIKYLFCVVSFVVDNVALEIALVGRNSSVDWLSIKGRFN